MMSVDVPDPDVDAGQVIVSLTVFSADPIDQLASFGTERAAGESEHRYSLGTITFDQPDWNARIDQLESALDTLLDFLDPLPEAVLHAEGTVVRIFMTLPRGAETISARLVRRLANLNVTLWIDT
jgi:hypothetical protein